MVIALWFTCCSLFWCSVSGVSGVVADGGSNIGVMLVVLSSLLFPTLFSSDE